MEEMKENGKECRKESAKTQNMRGGRDIYK